MKLLFKSTIASAAIFLSCGLVQAATPGAYFGAGIGVAQLGDITHFTQSDDSHLGGRAFVGYNFNNYLGLEANYYGLGSSRYTYYNRYYQLDYSINAIGLVGKAYIPLVDNSWNLYGLLGVAQLQGKWNIRERARVTLFERSPSALTATVGVGVNVELNSKLTTAFEVQVFEKKDDEIGFDFIPGSALASVSLSYKI